MGIPTVKQARSLAGALSEAQGVLYELFTIAENQDPHWTREDTRAIRKLYWMIARARQLFPDIRVPSEFWPTDIPPPL